VLIYSSRIIFNQWRIAVPKIKVRSGGQVKLPAAILSKYRLEDGDLLDVRDVDGGIFFIPERVKLDKKRRNAITERLWDRMEEEASEAIARGEVIGPFDNLEEALKALKTARI
jgi:bifunctional DNA-binding transcriptional regulator/antitoxin component of YhaV-PrlF toxin-antitoxin module